MKLQTRLLLPTLGAALMMLVLGGAVWLSTNAIRTSVETAEQATRTLVLTDQARAELLETSLAAYRILAWFSTYDEKRIRKEAERIDAAIDRASTHLTEAAKIPGLTTEEVQTFAAIGEEIAKYRKAIDMALDLAIDDKTSGAAMIQGADKRFQAISQRVNELTDKQLRKSEAATTDVASAVSRSLTTALALIAIMGLVVGTAWQLRQKLVQPLLDATDTMKALADGKLDLEIADTDRPDELGDIARATVVFQQAMRETTQQNWIKSQVAELAALMQMAETPRDFAQVLIARLVPLLEGAVAVFYVRHPDENRYERMATWGFTERKHLGSVYRPGEGLVGQCVLERKPILLTDVPADYIRIASGIGEAAPRALLVTPVVSGGGEVVGVIEIASFARFTPTQQALLDELMPIVALNLEILERNLKTRELLEETQAQAEQLAASEEELRAQSEALTASNDDLRLKTTVLENQAEELRASEEELRASDEELREQRNKLRALNEELTDKGDALEKKRIEADERAVELEAASRYKSEFLANMSHELRTPLNSLLILAKNLADNEEETLTQDQVESASIVHDSGQHLLRLINDILDLSKIEAGKMTVFLEDIVLADFAEQLRRRFAPLAGAKSLSLTFEVAPDLPSVIHCDGGKLDQIVTNLIGNALKFTTQGGVAVRLAREGDSLAVAVADTGIGISANKLERIFSAFEQADGSTSRRFGGTGLGLSISQRLTQLLGGDIRVASVEDQGTTFTTTLPLRTAAGALSFAAPKSPAPPVLLVPTVAPKQDEPANDDRTTLARGDKVMLVAEDDDHFARVLCDLAKKRGFKCLRAADGNVAVELATHYRPSGILLDIGLPKLDGWSVMETLKRNTATRHIPVHVISGTDERVRGMLLGAVGHLRKPVEKEHLNAAFDRIGHFIDGDIRRVLIVDDDVNSRKATSSLVRGSNVEIHEAHDGHGALEMLSSGQRYDCLILDLMLPDLTGFELLDRASTQGIDLPPVVVYSGKDLTYEENLKLREYTDSIVIKGARSPERLVDEVGLFLHSVRAVLPLEEKRKLATASEKDTALSGKTVLLVDDDMRNAFALSKVLRNKGLTVAIAQDGYKALAQIEENPRIDLVLMDIMMPGMDGFETIREVRKQPKFGALPIIALTAKAMAGDREKCIEAGANDYQTKPVDVDKLLGAIRALLVRTGETA